MKKYLVPFLLLICTGNACFSQTTDTILSVNEPVTTENVTPKKSNQVYKLNLAVDIPLTAVTTATTLYGFSKIYNKPRLTVEEVESLDPSMVNSFDRSATRHYSESATKVGDYD
jgi:hypothetical protein